LSGDSLVEAVFEVGGVDGAFTLDRDGQAEADFGVVG